MTIEHQSNKLQNAKERKAGANSEESVTLRCVVLLLLEQHLQRSEPT
jgi:hypothetical protein